MTRVLVFGTFDGIHPGHESFLEQAKAMGDELVVGVARDEHVMRLKSKAPKRKQQQRLESVRKFPGVYESRLCDSDLGSFDIIKSVNPDIIVLGHDQDMLQAALHKWLTSNDSRARIVRAKKFIPTKDVFS